MNFREFLTEANKYSFGSWKSVISLIITDFIEQPDDKLKKMLSKMKLHELKNTVRNAMAYIEHVENISKEQKKFLNKLIEFAKKEHDNVMIQNTANTLNDVSEKDWEKFEQLLQSHDKQYNKSEDAKVYQKGQKTKDEITHLYKILSKIDQKRADKLMRKY